MNNFMRSIPITPDMVSLWVPSGLNRAQDLIRGNHGQCYGTHPNVPVISTFQPPNLLTDGGLNIWTTETNLAHWTESIAGTSTINREATEKIEGDYSCRLDIDESNSVAYLFQNCTLVSSRRYKLAVRYMNSIAGKTAKLMVRNSAGNVWLKSDGTWQASLNYLDLPSSTTYSLYELEFISHADYTSYSFYLISNSAASSSIYFDNISIEELKPSLINPAVGWVFDGTNDYIDCGNPSSIAAIGKGDFTICFWLKSDVPIISYGHLFGKHQDVDNRIAFYSDGTANVIRLAFKKGGAGVNTNFSSTPFDQIWHHIVLVINRTTDKALLFVDAVKDLTEIDISSAPADCSNSADLYLGSRDGSALFFFGCQALPFIANSAWSAAQVSNFYNVTKGMFAPRG